MNWPSIPYAPWAETCSALHLWTQIVGKYRLAQTPWLNHSWHATLYVDPRGLTTGPVPDAGGAIEVRFDLRDHRLTIRSSLPAAAEFRLEPMTIAEFHQRFLESISTVGGTPKLHGRPNEVADPVPFAADHRRRPYDAAAVERFHQALVSISQVFERFRTGFLGKTSPVHLFWGSFDVAVTRFSGRAAPLHPGGVPNLPDAVTREAYSHEVSSAGFWPGGAGVDFPAFYSYAYPAPAGFDQAHVAPAEAFFHDALREFVLPYDSVRTAVRPESALMQFLQSTYQAAADLGRWNRAALECPVGEPGRPRPVGDDAVG